MFRGKNLPVALTIAGSDSGGGAGIQADLKTFQAFGVHGTSVITALTAQNPSKVIRIEATSLAILKDQLAAVFDEIPPQAVKTGMLYSAAIIRTVVRELARRKGFYLVVDPVMISSSGTRLLASSAMEVLKNELIPMATLVMPNVPEAEVLTGMGVRTPEDLRRAAKEIHRRFGCAALVKGGHLRGCREAIDIFFDGQKELLLSAPFQAAAKLHGTGCTYSAAITACLAKGFSLEKALLASKDYILQAIVRRGYAAGHPVLNSLHSR